MEKEITILDLAKQLNVSIATVSRALNNDPVVSKETQKRVFDLAKELGYRHNQFAANLRRKQTRTIGVLVHELQSNFITSVLSGIEKITSQAGYDIIIAHSGESYEKEKANVMNLFHKRVDGLIASLSFDTQCLDHFDPFKRKGVPVVFFDRVEENSDNPKVVIDNYKAGYIATQHLLNQGCERIVLVTASLKRNVYAQRYRGFVDAHKQRNLFPDENRVLIKDLSEQSGVQSALEVIGMNPKPDGMFITNDFVAAHCIRTLKKHGLRIPEDIAVVGFNNDAISRIVEPTLTTIDYPGNVMGVIAAKKLIACLKGEMDNKQTATMIIRSELLIRESSRRSVKK